MHHCSPLSEHFRVSSSCCKLQCTDSQLALTVECTARTIRAGGFQQGFDSLVWCVVGLQVFGGLIVGMVVKYADNIQKNFANALSVIFTVLGAIPLFGQVPSVWFILGVGFTMLSVFMYQQSMSPVRFCLIAFVHVLMTATYLCADDRSMSDKKRYIVLWRLPSC